MSQPKKVSRRQKLNALDLCARGEKQADVAYELGISVATIKRANRKLNTFGDIEGGRRKSGRKPVMTPDLINVIPQYQPR